MQRGLARFRRERPPQRLAIDADELASGGVMQGLRPSKQTFRKLVALQRPEQFDVWPVSGATQHREDRDGNNVEKQMVAPANEPWDLHACKTRLQTIKEVPFRVVHDRAGPDTNSYDVLVSIEVTHADWASASIPSTQRLNRMGGSRESRRFAIAVSFPGEHRRFVSKVVIRLAEVLGAKRVFYDEWYKEELVGLDGDLKLARYYREKSELIVPFFSRHYQKPWCGIEWHAIRAMLLERRAEDAVIPIKMDDTQIEGWESIDIAFRKRKQTARQVADFILAAYRHRSPKELGLEPIPRLPEVFPPSEIQDYHEIHPNGTGRQIPADPRTNQIPRFSELLRIQARWVGVDNDPLDETSATSRVKQYLRQLLNEQPSSAVVFRDGGSLQKHVSLYEIIERLRNHSRSQVSAVSLVTDFPLDTLESLWAIAECVQLGSNSGGVHWIDGHKLLCGLCTASSQRRPVDLIFEQLGVAPGHEDALLQHGPWHLFVFDFSAVTSTQCFGEFRDSLPRVLGILTSFLEAVQRTTPRIIIGFPRYLLSCPELNGFLTQPKQKTGQRSVEFTTYLAAPLFSSTYAFRAGFLKKMLGVSDDQHCVHAWTMPALRLRGVPATICESLRDLKVGGYPTQKLKEELKRRLGETGFSDHSKAILSETRGVLPEPLSSLVVCNSNALSFALWEFLTRPGRTPDLFDDLPPLASFLSDSGFHEMALRIRRFTRIPRGTNLASLTVATEPSDAISDNETDYDWNVAGQIDLLDPSAPIPRTALDATLLPRVAARSWLYGGSGTGKTTLLQQIEDRWSLPQIVDHGRSDCAWLPLRINDTGGAQLPDQVFADLDLLHLAECGTQREKWGWLRALVSSPLYLLLDDVDRFTNAALAQILDYLQEPDHRASCLCGPTGFLMAVRRIRRLSGSRMDEFDRLPAVDSWYLQPLSDSQINEVVAPSDKMSPLPDEVCRLRSVFVRNPFFLGLIRNLIVAGHRPNDLASRREAGIIELYLRVQTDREVKVTQEKTARDKIVTTLDRLADLAGCMLNEASADAAGTATLTLAQHEVSYAGKLGILAEGDADARQTPEFRHDWFKLFFAARFLDRQRIEDRQRILTNSHKTWVDAVPLWLELLEPRQHNEAFAMLQEIFQADAEILVRCLKRVNVGQVMSIATAPSFLESYCSKAAKIANLQKRAWHFSILEHLDPRILSVDDDEHWGKVQTLDGVTFRLARFPVTNQAYAEFLESDDFCSDAWWPAAEQRKLQTLSRCIPAFWYDSRFDRPNFPVVGVSMIEATAYCRWLSAHAERLRVKGVRYELPTADQWDWVAHARDRRVYWMMRGPMDVLHALLNLAVPRDDIYPDEPLDVEYLKQYLDTLRSQTSNRRPMPVGVCNDCTSGVYDMYGNVWEWCNTYVQASAPAIQPSSSTERSPVVVRGGPHPESTDPFAALIGGWFDPLTRWERLGFRIMRIDES